MKKNVLTALFLCGFVFNASAQTNNFITLDSLRGGVTKERAWWDLQHYDLSFDINPKTRFLKGENIITYKVLEPSRRLQIELQAPMKMLQAVQNGVSLPIEKKGMVHYITLKKKSSKGSVEKIKITFEGKPKISKRPPWDAGFTWAKDNNGNDFIATTCQGDGASIWWATKELGYDEPDKGADIRITIPHKKLFAVGNGRLIDTKKTNGKKTFHWRVTQPINNYSINANVGDYVHFSETFQGEKGVLSCNYYVLRENFLKAKKQFKQVQKTLEAFEYWFGAYPFYEDGYKLVEVPYLGMEHQSSVTYGNGYQNGYRGTDLSGTGVGLNFDFIIVHETGHEWFGNNISHKDIADMWIHEGFTAYSEMLYLMYHFGKKMAGKYVRGTRGRILNDRPIIGQYGVNEEGSGDMYYKGANMLHTISKIIGDKEKWRQILRGLNQTFYHQTVTTRQIENFISEKSGIDFSKVFDQYLRTVDIPVFEYRLKNEQLIYRWKNTVSNFDMPLNIFLNGKKQTIYPTEKWQSINFKGSEKELKIDPDFYVFKKRLD